MADTYYDVLGVPRSASADDVRKAYLGEARRWHPDRFATAGAEESARAEDEMRRVNEAWRVLGDRDERRAYDRRLSGVPANGAGVRIDDGVTRIDPRLLDPSLLDHRRRVAEAEADAKKVAFLRYVPWVTFLGLLAAIFVFTAVQTGRDSSPPPTTVAGPDLGVPANACVRRIAGGGLLEVPCDGPRDGVVIGARLPDGICPNGTALEVQVKADLVACLAP